MWVPASSRWHLRVTVAAMTATYRIEDTAHPTPEFESESISYNEIGFRYQRMSVFTCWDDGEYVTWWPHMESAREWCRERNAGLL